MNQFPTTYDKEETQKKLIEIFGNCEIKEKNKGYYILQSTKISV